jgi:hypothetical protein
MSMLLSVFTLAMANPGGKLGAAASGCTCHGNEAPRVEVTLEADTLQVDPGAIVNLTLTVANTGSAVAGFDLAAEEGEFVAGEGTRTDDSEITHDQPLDMTNDAASFMFSWSSPRDGTVRLYGAGLAGDGDGEETGDRWAFAEDVTIVVGTSISPDTGDTGEIEDTGGDTGGEPPPPCGCESGAGATGAAALVAGALLTRRRPRRD